MNNNLNPVAVVTGSTAGIGKAIALNLADAGYSLIVTGRREENEVSDLLHQIEKKNGSEGSSVYCRGDISETATRKKIISTVEKKFGYLSLLINNAGITTTGRKDILDLVEDDMINLLQVNLLAPFLLTSSSVPLLKKNKNRSYVVNISSISAYTVSTNRADYCMSKAAMAMMTEQFAVRLAPENIGVFEIRPGIIETDMTAPVKEKYDKKIDEGLLPISRWGQGSDVAQAVRAIVDGAFPYSTGQVFNVDGGFHIRQL